MMKIAPSLLSANFLELKNELDRISILPEINYIHYDVMDGNFVPNISFGFDILSQIKSHTADRFVLDVHLMINDPSRYFERFANAGADIITFHFETCLEHDVFSMIDQIKNLNCLAGISIKPETDVSEISKYLPFLDLVLVMSVNPGFGGQTFMQNSIEKISELSQFKKEYNYQYIIEVDGGINQSNFNLIKNNGADLAVLGSYFFKQNDYASLIEELYEK